MTVSETQNSELQFQTPPPDVRLVCWPLAVAPGRTLALLSGTVALATACGWLSQSPAMGWLTWSVLMLATWRAWLPVTYHLGRNGIDRTILSGRRHYDWWLFSAYETNERAILLMFEHATTTGGGLYIVCSEQRDNVLAVVNFYLGARRFAQISTVSPR